MCIEDKLLTERLQQWIMEKDVSVKQIIVVVCLSVCLFVSKSSPLVNDFVVSWHMYK